MNKWNLESWKKLPIEQSPGWEADHRLGGTLQSLVQKPPIVFKNEIILLKKRLKKAYHGEYFIVQNVHLSILNCVQIPPTRLRC